VIGHQSLELLAGVLAAAIGVMHQCVGLAPGKHPVSTVCGRCDKHEQDADACHLLRWDTVMGIFPVLDQSINFTCAFCGHASQSGVTRFDGGRKVGYLCCTCAEKSGRSVISPGQPQDPLLPFGPRINAWPILAICLTAIGTVGVVFILSGLAWAALRTILLLLSPHV
jgi:hypothetical protein